MNAIEFDHVSKQYRLGLVSTGTIAHDLNRFWQTRILHHEDPYLKIGETNDRSTKGSSEYVWALRDIDFKVEQGDVVGIIGRNGAGKSTLLKLLSRVTSPTTGEIRARGRIASLLEVGTGFHPEMTGRENIYMNGSIMGMTKAEIDRKLDEIVDFSGCERYIDTPVKRYSSGMAVRLGFAIAAHLEPEILVVDEVLAVGDAEFQKKAIGKMQDVAHGQGRTVLFVSHNMGAVRRLCKTGVLLSNGQVEYIGRIENTVERYCTLGKIEYGEIYTENLPRHGKCSGAIKYKKIVLHNENGKYVVPQTGMGIFIEFEYDIFSSDEKLYDVAFSLSRLGNNKFHCKAQYLISKNNKPRICCHIPKFPLSEGIYQMNIFISAGDTIVDYILNIPIEVSNGIFFGDRSIKIEQQMGNDYVYIPHNWIESIAVQ